MRNISTTNCCEYFQSSTLKIACLTTVQYIKYLRRVCWFRFFSSLIFSQNSVRVCRPTTAGDNEETVVEEKKPFEQ